MAGVWTGEAVCPSTEEFHQDAELGMDLVEGCRLAYSKLWTHQGREIALSHSVNMGTYGGPKDKEALIRSLLSPNDVKEGDKNWTSAFKWAKKTPRDESVFLARYSSLGNQFTFRGLWKIAKLSLGAVWLTSEPHAPLKRLFLQDKTQPSFHSDDIGVWRMEKSNEDTNLGVKLSLQPETPVISLSYAGQILRRRLWGCTEYTYFPRTGASLSAFGLKVAPTDEVTVTTTVSTSPNFEKTMEEGLKEVVVSAKTSAVGQVTPNLRVVAQADGQIGKLWSTSLFSLGYEFTMTRSRLCGEINSKAQLKSTLQLSEGLAFAGQVDYLSDSYKFGFSYELASQDSKN